MSTITNEQGDMRVLLVGSLATILVVTAVLVALYGWLGLVVVGLLVFSTLAALVAVVHSGWVDIPSGQPR